MIYIYALVDPMDGEVRYIGQTAYPKERYRAHLYDSVSNKTKTRWIERLKKREKYPILYLLSCTDEMAACKEETLWMARLKSSKLTNKMTRYNSDTKVHRSIMPTDHSRKRPKCWYIYPTPKLKDRVEPLIAERGIRKANEVILALLAKGLEFDHAMLKRETEMNRLADKLDLALKELEELRPIAKNGDLIDSVTSDVKKIKKALREKGVEI